MKCQLLSDWPVPVFIGLQCIFKKMGLKSCKNVINCKVYIVVCGLFLATLISMCVWSFSWCFLMYFFGIKKAIHVALVKPELTTQS